MIKERDSKIDTAAAEVLALRALAFVAGDADLGPRLLALTGLTADELRARAGDPAVLGATLDFLSGHEPSLIACAKALEITPSRLAQARQML